MFRSPKHQPLIHKPFSVFSQLLHMPWFNPLTAPTLYTTFLLFTVSHLCLSFSYMLWSWALKICFTPSIHLQFGLPSLCPLHLWLILSICPNNCSTFMYIYFLFLSLIHVYHIWHDWISNRHRQLNLRGKIPSLGSLYIYTELLPESAGPLK